MAVYYYKRVYDKKNINQLKSRYRNTKISKTDSELYYLVYVDNIATKRAKRKELSEMLDAITNNDVIEVDSLFDICWSAKDLKTIVDKVINEKQASLYSINDNLLIDNKTKDGIKAYDILLKYCSFQSECDKKRHREGIEAGKAKGNYKGRIPEPLPKNFDKYVKQYESKERSCKYIQQKLGMTSSTFYRRYNEWKKKQNKE